MHRKHHEPIRQPALELPEPVKINKWDGTAAKNAIDDAIREVLTNQLNCKESFLLIDLRLFLCSLAVGVAFFALLWDYLHPFPESKQVLITCVTSYFVLMGIITLYSTYIEKGIFTVVKDVHNEVTRKWKATSSIKKHDDKYHLDLYMSDAFGTYREGGFSRSIGYYIDINGYVVRSVISHDICKLFKSLSTDKKHK